MRSREALTLVKETVREWSSDQAPSLAAGLAYYTIFAVGPVLVIAIAIAGLVFGRDAARSEVIAQLQGLIGRQGAEVLAGLVAKASEPKTGVVAVVTGTATLVFGATGVFGALQGALNTIWEVKPVPRKGIWGFVRSRFLSLAMVLGVGFLLLVSLVVSAGLSALHRVSTRLVTGVDPVWNVVNVVVSLAVITLLFALIYKFLPDAKIEWRDVWIGAVATALLFVLGKYAIGLYLGNSSVGSAFGAAGSLVVVLLWIYYSAQIVFFGAEFTQVYAKRHGSWVDATPAEKAKEFAAPNEKGELKEALAHPPTRPGRLGLAGAALALFAGMVLGRRR